MRRLAVAPVLLLAVGLTEARLETAAPERKAAFRGGGRPRASAPPSHSRWQDSAWWWRRSGHARRRSRSARQAVVAWDTGAAGRGALPSLLRVSGDTDACAVTGASWGWPGRGAA